MVEAGLKPDKVNCTRCESKLTMCTDILDELEFKVNALLNQSVVADNCAVDLVKCMAEQDKTEVNRNNSSSGQILSKNGNSNPDWSRTLLENELVQVRSKKLHVYSIKTVLGKVHEFILNRKFY